MEPVTLKDIIDLANTLGVTALALWALMLFYRGDILSRKVYEELTKLLIPDLAEQISERIAERMKQK